MVSKEKLEQMVNNITMDQSTQNTEKINKRNYDFEQYKGDIRGLKKKLDFLGLSGDKLFSSTANRKCYRAITRNFEDR